MAGWGVLFSGQGSQYIGMGKMFYDTYTESREVFRRADDALQYPLSRIIFEGPEAALRDTEVQQPAIMTVSIAMWTALLSRRPGFTPKVGLGLSLGEYSAYVAAGALTLEEGVQVARLRGRAMQRAVPKGLGGMLAVLGLKADVVEDLCRQAAPAGVVEPANYNAPGQTVVSGMNAALDRVDAEARALGARTVRLSVSAPFHSSLLTAAEGEVAAALAGTRLADAAFPVLANVDMHPCTTPEEIIPRLIAQVSKPVLFEQSVRRAVAMELDGFLEVGPGRNLTSLVKKIERRQLVLNLEDPDGWAKALELV